MNPTDAGTLRYCLKKEGYECPHKGKRNIQDDSRAFLIELKVK